MKVLLIHHLEKIWEIGYQGIGNTSFEELCQKTADYIDDKNSDDGRYYDRVILTQYNYKGFNGNNPLSDDWEYAPLLDKIDSVHEYGYGWEINSFCDDAEEKEEFEQKLDEEGYVQQSGFKVIVGGAHSSLVVIDNWMEELARYKDTLELDLCGAFEFECIEDMQICLDYLGISYKKIYELIV